MIKRGTADGGSFFCCLPCVDRHYPLAQLKIYSGTDQDLITVFVAACVHLLLQYLHYIAFKQNRNHAATLHPQIFKRP